MLVYKVSSIFAVVITMFGLGQAEGVQPNPLCVLNHCDPNGLVGSLINIVCNTECIAANYTRGVCTGPTDEYPNRSSAKCTCIAGDEASINLAKIDCFPTCLAACLTCGFTNSTCLPSPPPGNVVECVCSGGPLLPLIPAVEPLVPILG